MISHASDSSSKEEGTHSTLKRSDIPFPRTITGTQASGFIDLLQMKTQVTELPDSCSTRFVMADHWDIRRIQAERCLIELEYAGSHHRNWCCDIWFSGPGINYVDYGIIMLLCQCWLLSANAAKHRHAATALFLLEIGEVRGTKVM